MKIIKLKENDVFICLKNYNNFDIITVSILIKILKLYKKNYNQIQKDYDNFEFEVKFTENEFNRYLEFLEDEKNTNENNTNQ